LFGDREHYLELILTELYSLPALETFAEWSSSIEKLEIANEKIKTEFLEWWNAYPDRRDGKGRRITALKGYLEARKLIEHSSLMSQLEDFNGTSGEFVKWPSNWLTNVANEARELKLSKPRWAIH